MVYVTSETPAAALDLDAIRARLRGMWAGGYPNAPGWPAQAAQDILALIAEIEAARRDLFILRNSEDAEVTMVEVQRDKALADLAEVTRQRDEAHVTIRAFVDDLDGGEWTTRQGWMNGDRFQTYTSSAEGFLPPTGPTHQQRIWTGPVEEIEQVARG